MDTQEIYFRAMEGVGADLEVDWDTRDEGDKFTGTANTNTNVPFRDPAWGFESPAQETCGVIETEHGLSIFDVVSIKELVYLTQLSYVVFR